MKKSAIIIILMALVQITYSQQIIYTISASQENQVAHLDSILFENLDNQTRFVVGNLPPLSAYDIDLTRRLLVTRVDQVEMPFEKAFRLVKNIPGEASLHYLGHATEHVRLSMYNMAGQNVYSQIIPELNPMEVITMSITGAGMFILCIETKLARVQYRVIGITSVMHAAYQLTSTQYFSHSNHTAPIETTIQRELLYDDFSFQPGDSIRVTPFLDGYFTYPHGSKISSSRSINFSMLKSSVDITGVSDMYRPMAEGAYNLLEYNTLTGGARFKLLTDTISLHPGDILTLDLDTIGIIQNVVSIDMLNGETIVETKPGYMDELFVEAAFKLDTRFMEPKTVLKSNANPAYIIQALTHENGSIHPVKAIWYGKDQTIITWSVFKDHAEKGGQENIMDIYKDLSGLDLYGRSGQNKHFFIDQGYTTLKTDAEFEFDFSYNGALTEDTRVKQGELVYYSFNMDADAGFQTKLVLDMDVMGEEVHRDTLSNIGNATVKFLVPPGVPVWVTFRCDMLSDYHVKVDAPHQASWGFESLHTVHTGGIFEKPTSSFSPFGEHTPENDIFPLHATGEGDAQVIFNLYPRLNMAFYGLPGPFAEIVPFVKTTYRAQWHSHEKMDDPETFLAWNSALDLGLDLRVGTSMGFLQEQAAAGFGPEVIHCFDTKMWAAPEKLELQSIIPGELLAGETIELACKVTDLLNLPLPSCTVSFHGDGEFSSKLPVTNAEGLVTIIWTPGYEAGEKIFTATLYSANKTVIQSLSGSTVITGPPPEAAFTGEPTIGRAPLTVSFVDQSMNDPKIWAWEFGDGNSSTLQNPTHIYLAPGTYTVQLAVTNAYGTDSETKTDYIRVTGPPPDVVFTGEPTSGATPLTVQFTDQSTNDPTSWSWDFGDGTTSNEQNPLKIYDYAGIYTVTLTAENAFGSNSFTRDSYITAGSAPIANFGGTPTFGTTPLTVEFTDRSRNNPIAWDWDFGDGTSSAQQHPSKIYDEAGVYTVKLTVSNALGSHSFTRNNYITAGSAPVAAFTSTPAAGIAPLSVQFTDQSMNNSTKWNWDFGDGTTSSQQNPKKTYYFPGNYTVMLTAENAFGSNTYTRSNYIVVSTYDGPMSGTFTDVRDNQNYKWVKIGSQVWMAENLKYLPSLADQYVLNAWKYPYYFVYDYEGTNVFEAKATANFQHYGVLYNWAAAMDGASSSNEVPSGVQGACPAGWHVPSHDEWTLLEQYICNMLGNSNCETVFRYNHSYIGYRGTNEGNALKSCRQVNSPLPDGCNTGFHPRWEANDLQYGFDEFGFTGLPGGYASDLLSYFQYAEYTHKGVDGSWWSATENVSHAWFRSLNFYMGNVYHATTPKGYGHSIRCIRDN